MLNPDSFNDTKEKLNYTTVNADIAWSLNMPLPRRYDAIIPLFGLSGLVALVVFLRKCGASILYCHTLFLNTRQSYESTYKCLQKSHFNFIVNFDFLHTFDLLAYLDSKVPVLMLLRDPISRLKTAVNHGGSKQKNDVFDINEAIHLAVDRIGYGDSDIPNMNVLNVWKSQAYIWQYNKTIKELRNSSFIHYIDMNEITQKRAFQTLKTLANRFHFPPPEEKDRKFFESKINSKFRYLLPIYFKINDNTKLLVQRRIFAPKEQIDILSELKINDLNLELGFFAKADEIQNFKDDEN